MTVAISSSKGDVDLNLRVLPLTLGCDLQLNLKKKKQTRENPHSVLDRFMILCQTTFIAIFD